MADTWIKVEYGTLEKIEVAKIATALGMDPNFDRHNGGGAKARAQGANRQSKHRLRDKVQQLRVRSTVVAMLAQRIVTARNADLLNEAEETQFKELRSELVRIRDYLAKLLKAIGRK